MVMDMLRTKKEQVKRGNLFTTARTIRKLSEEEIKEKIEKKAYELFEQRGCGHGNELGDWLEAERIVMAELGN